jgi:hypothetical protein
MKFLIPFCFLVFTYFRHSPVSIFRIAVIMIVGTWIERFTWIAGSVNSGPFGHSHLPFTGIFDVVVTVVVFAIALVLVQRAFARNNITVARTGGSTVATT